MKKGDLILLWGLVGHSSVPISYENTCYLETWFNQIYYAQRLLKSALSAEESDAPYATCPQSWGKWSFSSASELGEIVFLKCLDAYHKSPHSGERQYKTRT